MTLSLYSELTPWYHLLDPPDDHADEAGAYGAALEGAIRTPQPWTLLELGSGAGGNALHLKTRFACTLSDPSPDMLALSRGLNPECEHAPGDMRTVRLGRQFDAVLAHDAIMYMTSEADLAAAIETAFAHTRPGGAAVFAPDHVKETFAEGCDTFAEADAERALNGLSWSWDPDPADDTFVTDYVFLLRDADGVRPAHDRHVEGLFSIETWRRLLADAGFEVDTFERPLDEAASDQVFICRRP